MTHQISASVEASARKQEYSLFLQTEYILSIFPILLTEMESREVSIYVNNATYEKLAIGIVNRNHCHGQICHYQA